MPRIQNFGLAPGQQAMLVSNVTIGAAQLIAFSGGLIAVVPAPGVGKIIQPISVAILYNFGTVDFSPTPRLNIQIGATGAPVLSVGPTQLTGFGVSAAWLPLINYNGSGITASSGVSNIPLNLALTAGHFAAGIISAAGITAAGTGYALNDTGTITSGGGDATYIITGVGALGVVTSFAVTGAGTGYSTGAGQATATGGAQPGIGTGFTVNITAVQNGDGTIKVVTYYQIVPVP